MRETDDEFNPQKNPSNKILIPPYSPRFLDSEASEDDPPDPPAPVAPNNTVASPDNVGAQWRNFFKVEEFD